MNEHSSATSATDGSDGTRSPLGRRRFLGLMGISAAGIGAASAGLLGRDRSTAAPAGQTVGSTGAGANVPDIVVGPDRAAGGPNGGGTPAGGGAGRTLVVIDLEGGNDGLSTVFPAQDPTFARLRHNIRHLPDDAVSIGDGLYVNPGLEQLHRRGLRFVHGVGTEDPDLSHFTMADRWAKGTSSGADRLHTGFLGRMCDAIRGDEIITGLSVGPAYGVAMVSEAATTMPVAGPDGLDTLTRRDLWASELRDGLRLLSGGDQSRAPAHVGLERALDFARALGPVDEIGSGFPDHGLGQRLGFVSHVVKSGAGVRIMHVPFSGFDTHEGHRWRHDALMAELGSAVTALLDDLETAGLRDEVLIATTSEFGRRPQENGYGTDHGAASVALLAGGVAPGHSGEPSPLDDLDRHDNLRATTDMSGYYASLAADWLDIDPAQVLPGRPAPLVDSGIAAKI